MHVFGEGLLERGREMKNLLSYCTTWPKGPSDLHDHSHPLWRPNGSSYKYMGKYVFIYMNMSLDVYKPLKYLLNINYVLGTLSSIFNTWSHLIHETTLEERGILPISLSKNSGFYKLCKLLKTPQLITVPLLVTPHHAVYPNTNGLPLW